MDTKTVEEYLDNDLLNRIKNEVRNENWSEHHEFGWDMLTPVGRDFYWPEVCKRYTNERVSPLKKRIEELEDILEGIKHHHLSTVKHISDILLHPSTNGKQDR